MTILYPQRGITSSLAVMLLATFAIPCAGQSYSELVLAANPFAYWRLDEADGATVLTNSGTETVPDATFAGDTSGGDLTLGVPGLADADNAAVRFEGRAGSVQIPNSSFMNIGGPWEEKTIELWFSADEADTAEEQVLYEQGGTTRGLNLFIRENELFVGAWNAAADGAGAPWPGGTDLSDPANALFLSTPIQSNTTYHVALVVDGDPEAGSFMGTMTGYLNGEVFGAASGVGIMYAASNNSSIGASSSQTFFDRGNQLAGPTYNFVGVIDEVALYNNALPADVIFQHSGNDEVGLPGDFNTDGIVDVADFAILTDNFNGKFDRDESLSKGDFDRNTRVDLKDFVLFRQAFNAQPAGAAAVPEPSAGLLSCLGLIVLCLTTRRRRCVEDQLDGCSSDVPEQRDSSADRTVCLS